MSRGNVSSYKLCNTCNPQYPPNGGDYVIVSCSVCGSFKVVGSLTLSDKDDQIKEKLSVMTRRASEFQKDQLYLDSNNYKMYIDEFDSFSLYDRANFLIQYIGNKTEPGDWLELGDTHKFITASIKATQFNYIKDTLKDEGVLEYRNAPGQRTRLTFKGWQRLTDLNTLINIKLCFVAIPFDSCNIGLYNDHIKPLLKDELGLETIIVSEREHNEDIVDRIVYEINRCRFVIADASENNPNVFYEAGYARGLGKDVIWICKKGNEGEIKLPFDTRNINHIVWNTPDDLKSQLKMRILATIISPGEK